MPIKKKQRTELELLNMNQIKELMNSVMTDEARMKLVISLYCRAMRGNTAAFRLILQILGEDPAQQPKQPAIPAEPLEFIWAGEETEPEKLDKT